MVDPSLLRLAADRGVTICFADLDGADGLWVPEERTVLVNRRLSEREVAEVIEHELGHVAIDDQHADLDAGVSRPPPASSRRWAAALTAAACLAVVGGVTAGLTRGPDTIDKAPVVAPSAPPFITPSPGPGVFTTNGGSDEDVAVPRATTTGSPSGTTPAATTGPVVPTGPRAPSVTTPKPSVTSPQATDSQPADTTPPTANPTTPSPEPTPTTPPTEEQDGIDGADGSATTTPPAGTP